MVMGEHASRQARHQTSRRAKGLCSYGGCKVLTGGKYRCEVHAKEHAQMMRDRREPLPVVVEAPAGCACGAVEPGGVCEFYKSGEHQRSAA